MKSLMVILLTCVTLFVTSQIKVFPGGLQSYGSTTSPAYGEKHHFAGDLVVSEAGNTSSGCALLRANGSSNASSAGRPDFTWLGNNNTGIFHPANNTVGFTTNGTEKLRLGTYSLLLGSTTDDVGKLAITADADKMAIQSWSNYSWDGGTHEKVTVNRNLTHAYMLYSTATGSAVLTCYLNGSGDLWAKNNVSWSDRNLKENIDSLPNSLDKIKQLKGVKYNFKASFTGPGLKETELGLVAQDVEQILPEAVKTNEFGMKGIAYHSIIPVLIEAIKDLDRKNTQLQNDINTCCSKAPDGKNNRLINSSENSNSTEEGKSYLAQNKPNPFNKETVIDYNIVESGTAAILVFDMTGKLLKTVPVKIPGKGSITIQASDLQPGMYHYSLIVNDTEIDTKRMILTQ